jgi:ketosteroid isomerase-like protein
MTHPTRRPRRAAPRARLAAALLAAHLCGCARAVPAAGADGAPPAAAARASSEIVADLEASAAGWNRADMAAHLAIYADSATFMTATGPIVGKASTRSALERAFWRDGRPKQQLRFERVAVRPLGARHALATGRFTLSGGGEADRSGWFSLTWERTPAGWRVLHDHSS